MSSMLGARKSPLRSLGIIAPLAALAVFLLNRRYPGLGLGQGDVAAALELVDVVLGFGLAVIGRWRATTFLRRPPRR